MSIKNNSKKLVTFIFGTRPEAIKLAPVIKAFKEEKSIQTRVINTGQHKEILEDVLNVFEIDVDKKLEIIHDKPSLTNLNCQILNKLEKEFEICKPDLLVVQGDTATSYASSLSAFFKKIPVAHIEAGLRTYDIYQPFPEEINRRLISQIATLHFAPTDLAKQNLIRDNITKNVYNTGNTVIDAVLEISKTNHKKIVKNINYEKDNLILVTIHRRENWGNNLKNICFGLQKILKIHTDKELIFPLHPNKIVRDPIKKILKNEKRVHLIEPLNYIELVYLLKSCQFVITDSGGLQEEAPTFNKPVLIARDKTEREEGIKAGTSKLVGTNPENIFKAADQLIRDKKLYEEMAESSNPFGDGKASSRILHECLNFLKNLKSF